MQLLTLIKRNINIYRVIVGIGLIITIALALAFPVRMFGASPWAYYYGIQNFSQGKLVIDDQLHSAQVQDARQNGGMLQQYVEIGDNRWALEKAPGYVFYEVPFQWLGIPRWGNILLALGMIMVTYLFLKRLRDERTACIGSLLMLFTPVAMIMLNLVYMDTYASLAFLVMGGGLYLYYHLERHKMRPTAAAALLFASFFLISWSVVTRYTNFPVAAVLAAHYVITWFLEWRKGDRNTVYRKFLSAALGIGLPMAILLYYNYAVFGSPLDYGYHYSHMPVSFAYQYLGEVNKNGQSVPLTIILDNLKSAPKALLWGFPWLVAGIPGLLIILFYKFKAIRRPCDPVGRWSSLNSEIPWDILLVLIGWFIGVFCLYLMYEFTAEYLGDSSLIRFARFYLPGLFPIAVIGAVIIARLPFRLYIPVMAVAVIVSSLLYYQYFHQGESGAKGQPSQGNVPGMQQHQNSSRPGAALTPAAPNK